MDHSASPNGTARRVEAANLQPRPDLDLLWRAEVEDVLELAENTLSQQRPTTDQTETSRRFLEAGSPARAAKQSQTKVAPSNVNRSDGQVGTRGESFESRLDEKADQLVEVDVETTVRYTQPDRPVRIRYEFERPVTEIEDAHGQFFTIASEETQVPFQPGLPTTSLVQIISPEQYPGDPKPKTKTLRVKVEGTQAIWTNPAN